MTNFKDFLEEQLKDYEIMKEYERLDCEFDAICDRIDEYKRKYDNKECLRTPFGESYGRVLLLNIGCSPKDPYDNESACGHSCSSVLLFDSGIVQRKCLTCGRHERYYSLADAFVEINKTIDRRNTMRILQGALYIEKEIK